MVTAQRMTRSVSANRLLWTVLRAILRRARGRHQGRYRGAALDHSVLLHLDPALEALREYCVSVFGPFAEMLE